MKLKQTLLYTGIFLVSASITQAAITETNQGPGHRLIQLGTGSYVVGPQPTAESFTTGVFNQSLTSPTAGNNMTGQATSQQQTTLTRSVNEVSVTGQFSVSVNTYGNATSNLEVYFHLDADATFSLSGSAAEIFPNTNSLNWAGARIASADVNPFTAIGFGHIGSNTDDEAFPETGNFTGILLAGRSYELQVSCFDEFANQSAAVNNLQFKVTTVPEPSTAVLGAFGVLALLGLRTPSANSRRPTMRAAASGSACR